MAARTGTPGAIPPRLAFAAALLVLMALAPGCGGDQRRGEAETSTVATSGTTTQAQPPAGQTAGPPKVPSSASSDPARRAYIRRVDRICSKLDPEHTGARERVDKSTNESEAVNAYDDTIALWTKQLSEIKAVPAPPGDRSALVANIFDPIRRQLALRRQIRNALAAVDVPRLRQLRGELDNLTVALTAFARGYGFRVCGEE
jgi:hypothetical protein